MARRTISTRLAIEGEAQYKQAIAGINTELRNHKSALDLVNSQYSANANSMAALQAKQKALADVQTTQAGKVKELNAAYQNAQSAVDVYSNKKDELTQKIAENEAALEKLKNTEGDTTEEQKKLTEETARLKQELEQNEAKLTAAEKGANNWETSLNKAKIELNKTNDEIQKNDQYLEEAKNSTDNAATSIDEFGKETKKAGEGVDALSSALAAAGIVAALKQIADGMIACVEASIQFESAMTGVEKTTELTERELNQMADSFKKLSGEIPMTAAELAGIAENAGQLGIQKENIVGFTRTMADLGVATNLTGEEASQAIAKIANITGMAQTDFDRFGSSVVALGNNFATTERDIVTMSTRLAAAGTLAGISEAEILALATAMSSVGIEAEAGGTAMTQTFTEIEKAVEKGGENLEEFARISGMSSEDFSTKWKTAPMEAIQAFLSGLGKLESKGESATLVLDDMGLSGIRQSNMLKSLGLASETVGKAVETSNKAWGENTALTKEAELRYGTTESRLKLLNNAFDRVRITIGNQLNPALSKLIDAGTGALDWINDFLESNDAIVPIITAVSVGLGVMVVGITAMTLASTVGAKALVAFKAALDTATGGVTLIVTAVVGLVAALGTLVLSFDDGITRAGEMTEAARGLSESMKEIDAAFEENKKSNEVASIMAKEYVGQLKELESQGVKTTAEQDRYRMIVDLLNESMPGLNAEIDEQTKLIKGGTDALLGNIEALEQKYMLEAYQKNYNDLLTEQASIKVDLYDAERRETAEITKRNGLNEKREKIEGKINKRIQEQTENAKKLAKETGVLESYTGQYDETLQGLYAQLEDVNGEISRSEEQSGEHQKAIETSNEALAGMKDELGFAKEGYENLAAAQDEYIDQALELTEDQAAINDAIDLQKQKINDLEAAHEEAYYAAYDSIDGQIGLFETMSAEADRNINDLIASLDSQIAYMDTYAANIEKAMELGVDRGLVQKLSDGSQESAKILSAIVSGGEDNIKKLNEKFGNVEEGKQKFSTTVANMETDFDNSMKAINDSLKGLIRDMNKSDQALVAAENTGDSYAAGLRNKRNAVYNESFQLGRAAIDGYKKGAGQNSPSKYAIAEGKQTADSYAIGFESRTKHMEETTSKFAVSALDSYADTMKEITRKAAPIIYDLSGLKISQQQTAPARPVPTGGDIIVHVHGEGMIIRNDQDLRKISQNLATEAKRKIVAKGGLPG